VSAGIQRRTRKSSLAGVCSEGSHVGIQAGGSRQDVIIIEHHQVAGGSLIQQCVARGCGALLQERGRQQQRWGQALTQSGGWFGATGLCWNVMECGAC
jgi:hypothetical protein